MPTANPETEGVLLGEPEKSTDIVFETGDAAGNAEIDYDLWTELLSEADLSGNDISTDGFADEGGLARVSAIPAPRPFDPVVGALHAVASTFDADATTRFLATRLGAKALTRNQVITILKRLGWRCRTDAEYRQSLKNFQRGWNLGTKLKIDGIPGPLTSAALTLSNTRHLAGQPNASKSFSFSEFACKCAGRYSSCKRIWVQRAAIRALETLRTKDYPSGVSIVSGCRCDAHNKAVGGATLSQHRFGVAFDISYKITDTQMKALHLFSGIGRSTSTHKVRHVDLRHLSGYNKTGGTTTHPTIWDYAS